MEGSIKWGPNKPRESTKTSPIRNNDKFKKFIKEESVLMLTQSVIKVLNLYMYYTKVTSKICANKEVIIL